MGSDRKSSAPASVCTRYHVPPDVSLVALRALLTEIGREQLHPKQLDLLRPSSEPDTETQQDINLYYAGDLALLKRPTVAIVGAREVTDEGRSRTRRLVKELSAAGVVVMSGLARGVDSEAHVGAIASGGSTVAVIGTPITKAYPSENAPLQEEIYKHHLLISPFRNGEQVYRANFPKRNRIMAALSAATVIMEASDTSGSLHQAAECQRLGRWLFIARAVAEDPSLKWPSKFLGKPRTAVLVETSDVLAAVVNADA
jgi:DNA processing protein